MISKYYRNRSGSYQKLNICNDVISIDKLDEIHTKLYHPKIERFFKPLGMKMRESWTKSVHNNRSNRDISAANKDNVSIKGLKANRDRNVSRSSIKRPRFFLVDEYYLNETVPSGIEHWFFTTSYPRVVYRVSGAPFNSYASHVYVTLTIRGRRWTSNACPRCEDSLMECPARSSGSVAYHLPLRANAVTHSA